MPAVVNKDSCLGCETCVDDCPPGAISIDDNGYADIDADACVSCGTCVDICPAEAISMND